MKKVFKQVCFAMLFSCLTIAKAETPSTVSNNINNLNEGSIKEIITEAIKNPTYENLKKRDNLWESLIEKIPNTPESVFYNDNVTENSKNKSKEEIIQEILQTARNCENFDPFPLDDIPTLKSILQTLETEKVDIKRIYITDTNLETFPENFFEYKNLGKVLFMELSTNFKLATLPQNFFDNFKSLETLEIFKNNLTSLSENIFKNLFNLKSLWLGENQLSNLPSNIFKGLHNLEELSLGGCKLTSLPENIFSDLKNLKELYLHDNPLTEKDKEIIKKVLPNTKIIFKDQN